MLGGSADAFIGSGPPVQSRVEAPPFYLCCWQWGWQCGIGFLPAHPSVFQSVGDSVQGGCTNGIDSEPPTSSGIQVLLLELPVGIGGRACGL